MTGKLMDLPIESIDPGPNVRAKVDQELRASIAEYGLLQPITVAPREDDRYECLYGHRRLAAAQAAGLKTIAAVVQRDPEDLPLRRIVENHHRRALPPLDVAAALRAYLDEHPGARQVDVARKLGRSQYWVSQKLLLLHMDAALQAKVARGELRDDQAIQVHRAMTVREGRRGRPRSIDASSTQVVVELESPSGGSSGQATIGLDRSRRRVEVLLEDGDGYGVAVTMTPEAAATFGRRLNQAFAATQARPAA